MAELDATLLIPEDDTNEATCHWSVSFEIHIPHVTLEELAAFDIDPEEYDGYPWGIDEVIVQGTADGQAAIDRVKQYVLNAEEYGMQVEGFRLRGLTLISQAEVTL